MLKWLEKRKKKFYVQMSWWDSKHCRKFYESFPKYHQYCKIINTLEKPKSQHHAVLLMNKLSLSSLPGSSSWGSTNLLTTIIVIMPNKTHSMWVNYKSESQKANSYEANKALVYTFTCLVFVQNIAKQRG